MKTNRTLSIVLVLIMGGIGVFVVGADSPIHGEVLSPENLWHLLEPGLELGVFTAPQALVADPPSKIQVLRIEPQRFELRLLNASSNTPNQLLTAKEWCRQYNLVAAINASMYQEDYLTSISLMRTQTHVNNPRLSKDKTILAFDRQNTSVPLVKIIDRQCENFDDWKHKYATFVQSIRMISCQGKNVWRQQAKKWSMAVIATDTGGRVLFIHTRTPFSTYDLINALLELPLGIARAMYAEGGQEAQLYVHSGASEYEFVGASNTGLEELDNQHYALPIPNVVAITRRTPSVQ